SGAVRRTLWLTAMGPRPERVIARGPELLVAAPGQPAVAIASANGSPSTTAPASVNASTPFEAPDEDNLPKGGHVTQVDLDGDGLPDLLIRSDDQQRGPMRVLAYSGRTGRGLARWTVGAGQVAPLILDHGGQPALLVDRSDPDDPEHSALELVRLLIPLA